MNLQTRIARRGRCAFGAIRPKNDLRKTRALENLFVHFPIAAIVAGLAAGGVKCDFTSHLAGSWVVSNHTPQKSERTLDRMKVAAELDIRAGSNCSCNSRDGVACAARNCASKTTRPSVAACCVFLEIGLGIRITPSVVAIPGKFRSQCNRAPTHRRRARRASGKTTAASIGRPASPAVADAHDAPSST